MEISNLEEAEGLLSELRSLTKFRVWELLVRDVRDQIEGREQTLHEPLIKIDEIYEREFLKGEVSGMTTVVGYPMVAIENLEEYIKSQRGQEDDDS